ncbi:hypothetical protein WMY93_029138 [Mugilogobius chulae]|uniref:Claudin n=1 Tax=Mugilogobius chulae TaxID=88201 RepID=A0AAW0MZB7_9GOBI
MPLWRVSAFIGANLMSWRTGGRAVDELLKQIDRMQCKEYDSLLILPPELQAARGLACATIVIAVIAFVITLCGTKRTSCCGDSLAAKTTTLAVGGCFFLLACLTTLIPVCWVAHTVIRDFNNPVLMDAQKRELGAALGERRKMTEDSILAYALAPKADGVYLQRAPSSTHKTMEYV